MRIFKTACKSNHERVLNFCNIKEIPCIGYGDDWNCKFEIVYDHEKEISIDIYNRMFFGNEIAVFN